MTPNTELFEIPIPMLDLAQPTVPFRRLPLPESSLTFLPSSFIPHSRKRGRAAADVDGEHSCMQKKKRRLRLFFITSRLSPQFSHPATNIVDRGNSKIALWAKQRAAGRNLLPKAAILNRIRRAAVAAHDEVSRRRLLVEQEKEQRQLELARLTFNYGAIHTYTRPVHSPSEPIPPAATVRDANHQPISASPSRSPSSSPVTSRSPSPTSISPPLHDAAADYKSPNAAYALSPPRLPQPSTRTYEPYLPSPLGLSNYDAFDDVPGAQESASADLYSHLDEDEDDDNNDDRSSFFWPNDDDDYDGEGDGHRHDSPFSASAATRDSRSTLHTRASQVLKTPPPPQQQQQQQQQHASDIFAFSGLLGSDVGSDWWPVDSTAGSAKKTAWTGTRARDVWGYTVAGAGVGAGSCVAALAVQYPGAPVAFEGEPSAVIAAAPVTPVVETELVPACMSPNFLAADSADWGGEGKGKGKGKGEGEVS